VLRLGKIHGRQVICLVPKSWLTHQATNLSGTFIIAGFLTSLIPATNLGAVRRNYQAWHLNTTPFTFQKPERKTSQSRCQLNSFSVPGEVWLQRWNHTYNLATEPPPEPQKFRCSKFVRKCEGNCRAISKIVKQSWSEQQSRLYSYWVPGEVWLQRWNNLATEPLPNPKSFVVRHFVENVKEIFVKQFRNIFSNLPWKADPGTNPRTTFRPSALLT
jgi:hypothetical protein